MYATHDDENEMKLTIVYRKSHVSSIVVHMRYTSIRLLIFLFCK